MSIPRFDPLPAFNFQIALIDSSSTLKAIASGIAGFALGGFAECSGLESTLETAEYREGGVNDRIHRFPSRFTYSNIVLRQGTGLTDGLWRWHLEFLEGKGKRRDGLIVLQSEAKIPLKMWVFSRGLPVKWTGPAFNARASEVAIEALEIAHEKLELVSPAVAVASLF